MKDVKLSNIPSIVELLFLLGNSAVNLLLDLSQLKLSSEHLVLLCLESTLSLFKGSLELLLFSLERKRFKDKFYI